MEWSQSKMRRREDHAGKCFSSGDEDEDEDYRIVDDSGDGGVGLHICMEWPQSKRGKEIMQENVFAVAQWE